MLIIHWIHDIVANYWIHSTIARTLNFHYVNNEFVDSLILEAVELDDLESIEAILAWRNIKASEMGITEVDRRLLRMQKNAQEVIICAAIKNNYSIVKMLHSDGYKIFDKMAEVSDRFFFCNGWSQNLKRIPPLHIVRPVLSMSWRRFVVWGFQARLWCHQGRCRSHWFLRRPSLWPIVRSAWGSRMQGRERRFAGRMQWCFAVVWEQWRNL